MEGETASETKQTFYQHGAESPLHKEKYENSTEVEKAAFGKMVDEHLAQQGS